MGPLRADAPAWCLAPFEPEGLLRWKSDNINRRSWVFAVNNSSIWQSFPLSVQYRQYYQGQSGYITAMSWSISRLFLKTCFDLWVFKKCNAMWSRKFLICRLTRRDWSTGFWWAFRSSCSAFSYTSLKVLIHAYFLSYIGCHLQSLNSGFTCIAPLLQPSPSTSSSTASVMSASPAGQQELFSQLSIYWCGSY